LQWSIELQNLSFTAFDTDQKILSDINLKIAPGERLGILGPSGSGKSTLCFHLIGLQKIALIGKTEGQVLLNGRDISSRSFESLKEEMAFKPAMLLQNPESQIFANLVEEEIAYGLARQEDALIQKVLEQVGLSGYEKRPVKELSLGEKQRVLIAAMLAQNPSILVMDEPTNSLDGLAQAKFLESISHLPMTQIMIEHNLELLCGWAERIVEIQSGRIYFDGPVQAWLEQTQPPPRFLGLNGGNRGDLSPKNSDKLDMSFLRKQESEGVSYKEYDINSSEAILSFKNVHCAYSSQKMVIKDASFEIAKGQTTAVLGPNGSGKTTLLKHICGLRKPRSGEIFFNGTSIAKIKPEQFLGRIGYVYQNPEYQLFEDTVERECSFALKNLKLGPEEIRHRTHAWLDFFGLGVLSERSPFSLSYGEKRRLSLASVLVADPELILLDEPTTALDEANILALESLITALSTRHGKTCLIATHDVAFAFRVADSFLMIEKDGRVLIKQKQELNPKFLFENGFGLPITLKTCEHAHRAE